LTAANAAAKGGELLLCCVLGLVGVGRVCVGVRGAEIIDSTTFTYFGGKHRLFATWKSVTSPAKFQLATWNENVTVDINNDNNTIIILSIHRPSILP
jgi:hypothetical protein